MPSWRPSLGGLPQPGRRLRPGSWPLRRPRGGRPRPNRRPWPQPGRRMRPWPQPGRRMRSWPWPFAERHEEERLSALLDDELSVDEALDVTRHLASCDRCIRELELIREARCALRALPPLQPPQELLHHLVAEPSGVGVGHSPRARRLLSAAAVSIGLVAATAFTLGDDERGSVAPPVDVFLADHLIRVDGGPVLTPVDLDR